MPADFQCLDAPGGQRVRVRFAGEFGGRATLWEGEVMTLRYCCEQGDAGTAAALRPFIEVGARSGGVRRLRVGLPAPRIDRPTVAKAVIMVRNYRRLRVGRIEFGEPYECAPGRGDAPPGADRTP